MPRRRKRKAPVSSIGQHPKKQARHEDENPDAEEPKQESEAEGSRMRLRNASQRETRSRARIRVELERAEVDGHEPEKSAEVDQNIIKGTG